MDKLEFDIKDLLKGFDVLKYATCTVIECENDVYGQVYTKDNKRYVKAFTCPEMGGLIETCEDCRSIKYYQPRIDREIERNEKNHLKIKAQRQADEEKAASKNTYRPKMKGSGRF